MDKIKNLEVHPLANQVPMALQEEQKALELNIKKNGQQIPILLYRGKIIDGRCRAMACLALNITVRTETLPNNLTIAEVTAKVKSLNTRRNLTKAQKAVIAARQYRPNTEVTQKDISEAWGVDKREFTAANYLMKNRPDYAEALFLGKRCPIGSGKNSHSVRTVADAVKAEIQQLQSTLPDASNAHDHDFTNIIATAAGKKNYANSIKRIGGDNPKSFDAHSYGGNEVRQFLAEIADHFTTPIAPPSAKPAQPTATPTPLFQGNNP